MKKLILSSVLAATLPTFSVNAIGIDAMIKVAENGEALFSVTNADGYRQFISTLVSEVNVVDGELKMTPYNRENISDWGLEVRPARTVIDHNAAKTFKVVSKIAESDRDNVYQITYVPMPYFQDGERPPHAVQMAVGFAPILIVPAKEDKPLKYEVKHTGESVKIHNKGETYLNVVLDACGKGIDFAERKNCSKVVYALSGRELSVPLEGIMKSKPNIHVELMTNSNDFSDEFTLEQNSVRSK